MGAAFAVRGFPGGRPASALEILRKELPPVVTIDLGLPPSAGDTSEGFRAFGEMLRIDPLVKVLVITGQDEHKNALAAIGQGAYDFFSMPVDLEALKVVITGCLLAARRRPDGSFPDQFRCHMLVVESGSVRLPTQHLGSHKHS